MPALRLRSQFERGDFYLFSQQWIQVLIWSTLNSAKRWVDHEPTQNILNTEETSRLDENFGRFHLYSTNKSNTSWNNIHIKLCCHFTAGIYIFRVKNKDTRKISTICSKLPIMTLKQRCWLTTWSSLRALIKFTHSQQAITCSKLTIKTPKQGVKHVQS